eukprot:gene13303-biopygen3604
MPKRGCDSGGDLGDRVGATVRDLTWGLRLTFCCGVTQWGKGRQRSNIQKSPGTQNRLGDAPLWEMALFLRVPKSSKTPPIELRVEVHHLYLAKMVPVKEFLPTALIWPDGPMAAKFDNSVTCGYQTYFEISE